MAEQNNHTQQKEANSTICHYREGIRELYNLSKKKITGLDPDIFVQGGPTFTPLLLLF